MTARRIILANHSDLLDLREYECEQLDGLHVGTFVAWTRQRRGPIVSHNAALYADVAGILAGESVEPPAPSIGTRTDGTALLYAGMVNVFVGDPESAKTLAASAIAADLLLSGGSALWVDLDHNGARESVSRLRAFGVPSATLGDPMRFRYADPEDKEHLLAVVREAADWRPDFALIDSMGELLPLVGASSNDADEFTEVNRATLSALARTGACVLAIDHLSKNTDSARFGATGTVAKKRAVNGAMIRFTVKETFVPGAGGRSELTIVKDRFGGLRSTSVKMGRAEMLAATFHLTEREGVLNWHFWAPDGAPVAPASDTDADVVALRALNPPPKTVRDVTARMRWRNKRAGDALRAFRAGAD